MSGELTTILVLGESVCQREGEEKPMTMHRKINELRKRTSVGNSFKKLGCEGDNMEPNLGKVLGLGRHLLLVLKRKDYDHVKKKRGISSTKRKTQRRKEVICWMTQMKRWEGIVGST